MVIKSVAIHIIGLGKSKDCSVSEDDYRAFMSWLQCYENPEMKNLVDHNGRTIWFDVSVVPVIIIRVSACDDYSLY